MVAWGLLVPLLIFFLGPQLQHFLPAGAQPEDWLDCERECRVALHRAADRGGQHDGGRRYTLFRMRKNLSAGLGEAFAELRSGGRQPRTSAAPSGT